MGDVLPTFSPGSGFSPLGPGVAQLGPVLTQSVFIIGTVKILCLLPGNTTPAMTFLILGHDVALQFPKYDQALLSMCI